MKTDGFDSKHEADCYKKLKLREKGKEVTGIQCQVKFQLSTCSYIADFVYFDLLTKMWVVADAKGMRTAVYNLKKKMMLYELGIAIVEV